MNKEFGRGGWSYGGREGTFVSQSSGDDQQKSPVGKRAANRACILAFLQSCRTRLLGSLYILVFVRVNDNALTLLNEWRYHNGNTIAELGGLV